MALWIRGGKKNRSWTLHLQSAQWVVLVTTNFSLSLSRGPPSSPHLLIFLNNSFILTSAFLQGLSFLSRVWPASFFSLSLISFILCPLRTSGQCRIVLTNFCRSSRGKSIGLLEARGDMLWWSEGNWTLEDWVCNGSYSRCGGFELSLDLDFCHVTNIFHNALTFFVVSANPSFDLQLRRLCVYNNLQLFSLNNQGLFFITWCY